MEKRIVGLCYLIGVRFFNLLYLNGNNSSVDVIILFCIHQLYIIYNDSTVVVCYRQDGV